MKSLYKILIKLITPMIMFFGKIHAPFSHKQITGEFYYTWRKLLLPGDVLLATTFGELSNILNPSEIKHGALYLGGETIKYVGEAIGKGVVETDLVSFLLKKDIVIIVRKKGIRDSERKLVVKTGRELIKKRLEYGFGEGLDDMYCYEYVIQVFKTAFPQTEFKKVEFLPNKLIYECETFLNDPKNWEILVDSRQYIKKG